MTKKVKLAIFDKDLKAREFGKYPVTEDGSKIKVRSGGKRNFNPSFDNDSYIEFPKRSFPKFWKIEWDRVYFAPNGARACVNFRTEEVLEPDPELVIKAAENTILQNMGTEKTETPIWTFILLGINLLILLKVLGVIA